MKKFFFHKMLTVGPHGVNVLGLPSRVPVELLQVRRVVDLLAGGRVATQLYEKNLK